MTCGGCFPPLPDTPKADAPEGALRAHVQRIRMAFAVRGFDYVLLSCSWCTRSDLLLDVRRRRQGYEQSYCCKDCAGAADAYLKLVQKSSLTPPLTGDKVDEGEDTC